MFTKSTKAAVAALALMLLSSPGHAYDVTDWLSLGGVAALGGQCQELADGAGASDACRGALPVQLEASVRPTSQDEVFVKLGFAAGNGLNRVSPFSTVPWAADLHDDLTDINGRYDHLLTAWYRHEFNFAGDTTLPDDATLGLTVGIIDATDYLDDNAYSNDEFTQFMNSALVNGPHGFLPSYDIGGAVELGIGSWTMRGVAMNVGDNDAGNDYTFVGAQVGYTLVSSWGEGTYRINLSGTSDDFETPDTGRAAGRFGGGLSFDQQLGDVIGVWIRFGWQETTAAVDAAGLYSGGINIVGSPWGRPDDNIGIGYAFLDGGNGELAAAHAAEVYYRLAIAEHFGLTADAQYLNDNLKGDTGPSGFILGLRATATF